MRAEIAAGADLEQREGVDLSRSQTGRTSLVAAAYWGYAAVVTELVAARADVNAADNVQPCGRAPTLARPSPCPPSFTTPVIVG